MELARFRKKRVFALLFVAFIIILFYNNQWLGKLMYPVKYEDEIVASAEASGVEPYLIAAVIRTESKFKTGNVSKKGAVGLMQIMPDTARWILEQTSRDPALLSELDEPELNIELGSWYLASLRKQFASVLETLPNDEDRIALVAASYNAGPGNVSKWLSDGVWSGRYNESQAIPYGETRHYVQRVVYFYKKYERYYDDIWYN